MPHNEVAFQKWYKKWAKSTGINLNPDDPKHHYDYRAAYKAGAKPDESGHWPSKFKSPTHPNRFVEGIDTRTGKPIKRAKIMNPQLRKHISYQLGRKGTETDAALNDLVAQWAGKDLQPWLAKAGKDYPELRGSYQLGRTEGPSRIGIPWDQPGAGGAQSPVSGLSIDPNAPIQTSTAGGAGLPTGEAGVDYTSQPLEDISGEMAGAYGEFKDWLATQREDVEGAAGRAGADVAGQADIARQSEARRMMGMGIDPTSGRFGALSRRSALDEARNKAAAMTRARGVERERATGIRMAGEQQLTGMMGQRAGVGGEISRLRDIGVGREWGTGERLGAQRWQAVQRRAGERWRTGEAEKAWQRGILGEYYRQYGGRVKGNRTSGIPIKRQRGGRVDSRRETIRMPLVTYGVTELQGGEAPIGVATKRGYRHPQAPRPSYADVPIERREGISRRSRSADTTVTVPPGATDVTYGGGATDPNAPLYEDDTGGAYPETGYPYGYGGATGDGYLEQEDPSIGPIGDGGGGRIPSSGMGMGEDPTADIFRGAPQPSRQRDPWQLTARREERTWQAKQAGIGRDWTAVQDALNRAWQTAEREGQNGWQGTQNELSRQMQINQAKLNRAWQDQNREDMQKFQAQQTLLMQEWEDSRTMRPWETAGYKTREEAITGIGKRREERTAFFAKIQGRLGLQYGGLVRRQRGLPEPQEYVVGEEGRETYVADDGRPRYAVGIRGPEVRTFPEAGRIIPNPKTQRRMRRRPQRRCGGTVVAARKA